MKDINHEEMEVYTKIIMKCVVDYDFSDEEFIKYLLNYKKEIIEGCNFKQREYYGVIKSDLWGYIKNNTNENSREKWGKILGKKINEPGKYEYLKFKYYDREKNERKLEYKPLFFKEEIKKNQYIEISEEFLKISDDNKNAEGINIKKLSENEIKLIINDCLNDSNINRYRKLEKISNFEELVERIKNYLVNNVKEIEILAKEEKKGFLRLISTGNSLINKAFQSIKGKEREEFIEKNELEENLMTYMRYKNISKNFFIECLYNYKDKNFWIKKLGCYSTIKNEFYIENAIKDIIFITNGVNNIYESEEYRKEINWDQYKYYTEIDSMISDNKYERIGKILDFFKEEIKNSNNYHKEIEKLMLVAVGKKNQELYKVIKNFITDENGKEEKIEMKNAVFKSICEKREDFFIKWREEEKKQLNEKLKNNLIEKGVKDKKNKI